MSLSYTSTWTGRMHSLSKLGLPTVFTVLFVTFWEFGLPALGIPQFILPTPSAIVAALLAEYPTLIAELLVTLQEFAIGFGLSVVLGYFLSLVMFFWTAFEHTFYPYVIIYRSIPVITLLPIFIIWFGFGFNSIVAISFLLSFFPMVVNSLSGFKSTDDDVVAMLESFSGSRRQLYWNVYRYSSLPLVFAGIKVSIILAFTGAIVGEFLIGQHGIGFMALHYNNNFEIPEMFAAIFVVSITQLIIFGSVVLLERRTVTW